MNDGGPAFPRPAFTGESPEDGEIIESHSQQGMSLRDWFAGMALNGNLASESADFCCRPNADKGLKREEVMAIDCYRLADAMLKARGQ